MVTDKLTLDDVRFYGQHGTTREERAVGAWFSVDVEMTLDLGPASVSDELAATVDYGARDAVERASVVPELRRRDRHHARRGGIARADAADRARARTDAAPRHAGIDTVRRAHARHRYPALR